MRHAAQLYIHARSIRVWLICDQIITIFAAKLGDIEVVAQTCHISLVLCPVLISPAHTSHMMLPQVATHNSVITVFFFVTSSLFGISTATNIRVSHYLGANNPIKAKRCLYVAMYSFLAVCPSQPLGLIDTAAWPFCHSPGSPSLVEW